MMTESEQLADGCKATQGGEVGEAPSRGKRGNK